MSLLLLFSCAAPDPSQTLTGRWRLLRYEHLHEGWALEAPDNLPRPVRIEFDDRGAGGRFRGETPTNYFSGRYRIWPGGAMELRELASSLRGEPAWSAGLWDALEAASSYRRSPAQLELYYRQDSLRMVFAAE